MSDEVTLTIPRVRVLTGHTDPDTAYMVDDYPYSFRLRCRKRYWIDTRTSSKGMVDQRMTSQTTNPKQEGTVWNKPKSSIYSAFVVMYLNDLNYVEAHHIPAGITGEEDTRARHMGVYEALGDEERDRYEALLNLSRRLNPTVWGEWYAKRDLLVEFITATGNDPVLVNKVWTAPDGRRHYLSDPAAYVTAAREVIAARST